MKHILLTGITLLILSISGMAQSLALYDGDRLVTNDTLYVIGTTNDGVMESHVTVKNLTDKEIEVHAKKEHLAIVEETDNNFCWGASCFPPFIFVSVAAQKIDAEGTDDTFKGEYAHDGHEGTTSIRYTFYNNANPEDSVSVVVLYQVGAAGVQDWTLSPELFKAYPNPTDGPLQIDFPGAYDQRIQIEVMSITGQTVEQVQLPFGQASYRVNLSAYHKGYYFVKIQNQKGQAAVKRILLNR